MRAAIPPLLAIALLASAATPAAPRDTQEAPRVVKKGDRYFVGSKEVEIKDGVPWMDGKPMESFTLVRSGEQVAEDRVELPGANVARTMLHVPASRLGPGVALPRLFVFDASTGEIAKAEQLPAPLIELLSQKIFLSSLAGVPKGTSSTPLAASLRHAVDSRGVRVSPEIGADARIVVVQWWAGWCHPCLEEGKLIAEQFVRTPMPDVKWIAVEMDPTRTEASYRATAKSTEAAQ